MKLRLLLALVAAAGVGGLAPGPDAAAKPAKPKKESKPTVKEGPTGDLFATLQTSMGEILVKLYEKDAPKAVENFVGLATGKKEWKNPATGDWENRPLYDGTTFHRVIPGFMIQGGDPYTGAGGDPARAGSGNPGYRFEDEFQNGHVFDRGGYLAMANSGPDTNGSQFFITEAPQPHLNNKHTIFGEVVAGLELVPRIAEAGNGKTQLVKVTIVRGALLQQQQKKK
jgi:peptidyl-prolyl cis-trans isomerase A (cyclophilin A)